MSKFYIVQGQTEPIDVQLFRDRVPLDLTGLPVPTLILRGLTGSLVDTTADVSVLEATTGKLRYLPEATAFDPAQSPYVGRWRVVDATGKIGFWPNREVDQWIVRL